MPIGIYARPSALSRFWNLTDKNGPKHPVCGQCWKWLGAPNGSNGYGRFKSETRYLPAHVYSYRIHIGPIPKGHIICHKCDNPLCVNPKHLFLGTHLTNARDRNKKGRHSKGEDRPAHKLTEAQVEEIRRRYRRTSYHRSNCVALAKEFNVVPTTIQGIVSGKQWKHLLIPSS